MKCILNVFLIFCLAVCLLPASAFATDSKYYLDEIGMSISLPDDYIVFTRDLKSNDPNLSTYGLTKDGLTSLMLERNIYLNAWDENVNYEIIVTMIDSPSEDFNQFSDSELTALTSALSKEYENVGITYIKSSVYQHSQAKFIKIYISQPNNGDTAYGLQYYTVYGSKAINVTLQSYSGKIDYEKESILKGIMDTVHFDTDSQFNKSPAQTVGFTYTDDSSGLIFTVPANWVEVPMNEDRDYIDAKFTSKLEEGLCIIFSSNDIYGSEEFQSELSVIEKLFLGRDVIGNDLLTKTDVAEMYGCKEEDVSMVTYGGKEYYSVETVAIGTAYGMTVSVPMVCLLHCENGYVYTFQFNGSSKSTYFQDFKVLVNSTVYPEFEDAVKVREQVLGAYLLLALILLMAICSLPIIIYRYVIKKKPVNKKKAKKMALIYGICMFVVSVFVIIVLKIGWVLGAIVLLWSWVNYRVLIGECGKETITHVTDAKTNVIMDEPVIEYQEETYTDASPDKEPVAQYTTSEIDTEEKKKFKAEAPMDEEVYSVGFCHRCGNKLVSGSIFCNKCGTKVPTAEKNY